MWIFAVPLIRFINIHQQPPEKVIACYALPAAAAVLHFWNLGLIQVASVTGVVGVSFVVTLFASVANYIWEEGIRKDTVINAVGYGIAVVVITGIGMTTVEKITASDKTVRATASVGNFNLLLEYKSILARYDGSDEEKMFHANIEIIKGRAKQAVQNYATLLIFPEDAFVCPES